MNEPTLTSVDPPWSPGARWGGLLLILTPLLFRGSVPFSPLPYWDSDPLSAAVPMLGLGPAGAMQCDLLVLLGAALLTLGTAHRPSPRGWWWLLLLTAIGCFGVGHHAFAELSTLAAQRIGLAWSAAMFAALALTRCDAPMRLGAFACITGWCAMLGLKCLVQVFVENPGTIEHFKQNKESILAANGWTADSSMARGYTRRILDSSSTGWYAFSNIVASFGVVGLVASVGVMLQRWLPGSPASTINTSDESEDGQRGIASLAARLGAPTGAILSLSTLYCCGAKGGYAAALLGLILLALFAWRANRQPLAPTPTAPPRFTCLLGPAVISLVLLAITLRGLIGERIGELSILFRWFYLQAATRIAHANPVWGVGPDGFKESYQLLKNPLSPEEVTSPHSILFDWWSTLGLFGLAWVIALICLSTRIGRAALAPAEPAPPTDPSAQSFFPRAPLRFALAVAAAVTLLAALCDRPAMTPEVAFTRFGGLILWAAATAAIVLRAGNGRAWRIALPAAALALLAHMQIELTASWSESAGLALALIGIAASGATAFTDHAHRLPSRFAALAILVVAVAAAPFALRAREWQHFLRLAADRLEPIGRARMLLSSAGPSEMPQVRAAIADLAGLVGHDIPVEPAAVERALLEAELDFIPSTYLLLDKAADAAHNDWSARQELSELILRYAGAARKLNPVSGDSPLVWAAHVITATRDGYEIGAALIHLLPTPTYDVFPPPPPPDSLLQLKRLAASIPTDTLPASQLAWLATIHETAFSMTNLPEHLTIAAAALRSAMAKDPYSPTHPQRLLRIARQLGDPEAIRRAAVDTIRVDDLQRLDRAVRGLSPAQRAEVESLAHPPSKP